MLKKISLALFGVLLTTAGCVTPAAQAPAEPYQRPQVVQSNVFNVPPKQLLQIVEKTVTAPPFSLTIEQKQQGTILTSYKEGYRGEWHIARYWQERTRYRILVIPDWDEPTSRARLEISDESQTRSNDLGTFQDAPQIQRPDRSGELLDAIKKQLPK